MHSLLLLELNEVNFDYIRAYIRRGELPAMKALLDEFGYSETTSEQQYEHLEPWIQWVTAHTGRSLAEHRVFRLGDVERLQGVEQIWERLEREKVSPVGAISPMNAKNCITNGFFLPDPWTNTPASGSFVLRKMGQAVAQAVNDNATNRLALSSVCWLAVGALANARIGNYLEYVKLVIASLSRSWVRASFLDLLLADTFISQVKRNRPRFASLFLNAAAHIQHHYMFSSGVYDGPNRNPDWYVRAGYDPLLDIYRLYDRVVRAVRQSFPASRIMIATGLHQDPHEHLTYYWRLRNHGAFLKEVGVAFREILPRMSRDFLVVCDSEAAARTAQARLSSLRDRRGVPVFEVDNRGMDLFVTLTYDREIGRGLDLLSDELVIRDFDRYVAFVALKNGIHNGVGYFVDTGVPKNSLPPVFPLSNLPDLIADAV